MDKKVKLYTNDGVIEVAAKDLPPGVMLGQSQDGERIYVSSELVRQRDEPVHPPFTGERLRRLKRVHAILKDVHYGDPSFESWHHNFRCNDSEENELALYKDIARVYPRLVNSATSLSRRRDIYRVIVALTLVDCVEALRATLGQTYYRLGVEKIAKIANAWVEETRCYKGRIGHCRFK